MNRYFGGIKQMDRLPSAVFIIDTVKEAIAVAEIMRGFDVSGGQLLDGLSDRVASGRLDPFTAADELRKTTDSM